MPVVSAQLFMYSERAVSVVGSVGLLALAGPPGSIAALTAPANTTALAAAGAATSTLRVGSYVLAVTNHRPAAIAHEALTLDALSEGRLELGLGAGRPDAQHEAAALGFSFGTPGERIALLHETIHAVRERFAQKGNGPLQPVQQPHPPLLIAAVGDRMLRLAAQEADIVALGLP